MRLKRKKLQKQILVGWVAETFSLLKLQDESGLYLHVYRTRGIQTDWNPCSWPPRKVRITIEEIE